jgi:uncharacterized protein YneF (UPF0154 family)
MDIVEACVCIFLGLLIGEILRVKWTKRKLRKNPLPP